MTYTVYGAINDGRNGYPNMPQQLDWTEHNDARSYIDAMYLHMNLMGAARSSGRTMYRVEEIERGRINGANYRDYNITYGAKDGGEDITREIRVFCRK